MGADFNALEAKIGAILPNDPNKIKVYVDGYDSHCYHAYAYFGDKMPDIVATVDSVNSIKDKYGAERSESKAPTFALQYFGTYMTLMKNCGFSEEKAKAIEAKFQDLYKVSIAYANKRLDQAHEDGYLTLAFGLRVRTPLMAKFDIKSGKRMPFYVESERRTGGNALSQSYGLLNSRAGVEFQEKTLASKYWDRILPCAHIHDAQYFIIDDDIEVVEWLNNNLVACMEYQDQMPEIKHSQIKIGGELDLFYPDWSSALTLPNQATKEQITVLADEYVIKLEEAV